MKIRVITVGRISSWAREAERHFKKMLSRFSKIEVLHLKSGGDLNRENPGEVRSREGKRITKVKKGFSIALDVRGKRMSTDEFTRFLENLLGKEVSFIIGGAAGLSDEVLSSVDLKISLSEMTLSHEVAFVLLLEQLFRAFKRMKGEKYDY